MSLLTDFQSAHFATARTIIGASSLVIGDGDAVSGVVGERETSRDFEMGGFSPEDSASIVVLLSDFSAAYPLAVTAYHGKTATVDGTTYRISSITVRDPHVIVRLTSTTESA